MRLLQKRGGHGAAALGRGGQRGARCGGARVLRGRRRLGAVRSEGAAASSSSPRPARAAGCERHERGALSGRRSAPSSRRSPRAGPCRRFPGSSHGMSPGSPPPLAARSRSLSFPGLSDGITRARREAKMGPRWARRRRSGGGSALLLLLGHCWLWAAGADDNGSQLSYYTALINVTVLSPERGGPTLLRIDRGRYGQDSPKVEVKGLLVTPVPINGGNGPAPRRVGARGGGGSGGGGTCPRGSGRAVRRDGAAAVRCVCVCVGVAFRAVRPSRCLRPWGRCWRVRPYARPAPCC